MDGAYAFSGTSGKKRRLRAPFFAHGPTGCRTVRVGSNQVRVVRKGTCFSGRARTSTAERNGVGLHFSWARYSKAIKPIESCQSISIGLSRLLTLRSYPRGIYWKMNWSVVKLKTGGSTFPLDEATARIES